MFKPITLLFLFIFCSASSQISKETILGKWMATDKSVAVYVYKEGSQFRAKVLWFDERLGNGTPMNTRRDTHNPNEKLRTRKVIGMDILENLKFNQADNRWENGKIYDASSGRTWDTFAEIKKDGALYVRGYWKFTWIGKRFILKDSKAKTYCYFFRKKSIFWILLLFLNN
jgi:uncharacterized protein (DUF2147 family)